jgi:hypothetical protein
MKTVLQIAEQALDELGIPVPSSIVDTTDYGQRQINALLRAASESLRTQRVFPQQKKRYTWDVSAADVAASRYRWPLPEDYFAALPNTQWDEDAEWRLIGPLSDGEFTDRTVGGDNVTQRTAYRIFGPDFNPTTSGGQFMVNPIPTTSGLTFSFEYITKTIFLPKFWSASVAFGATTYCSANGNIYYTTAGGTTGATIPSHTTGSASDGTVTWVYISAPKETIALDTDLCLFDDDLMVAELKWRYLRAKKKDYQQEYSDAQTLLMGAVARLEGSRVGSFEGKAREVKYELPDGSWTF